MTHDGTDRARRPLPFATRISTDIALRLRLAALVRKTSLTRLVDEALDRHLPPVGELAEQIQGGARDEH